MNRRSGPGRLTSDEPAIEIRDLDFRYPDGTTALLGVSMTVHHGESVALLGGNGAGKTTLALHLNGLLTPLPDRLRVVGLDVADGSNLAELRRRLQVVFANPDDQLFMPTVREDVAFGPRNLGLGRNDVADRVKGVLAAVGAAHLIDRPPHRLSTGEKRRVALATSLAMDPDLLVLDEPSAGLDPGGRRQLVELLRPLAQTRLIITHDLALAAALCPRSVVMEDGRIVADMATETLLSDGELLEHHDLAPGLGEPSTATGTRLGQQPVSHRDPGHYDREPPLSAERAARQGE